MGRQSEQRYIREAIEAERLAAEWEEQETLWEGIDGAAYTERWHRAIAWAYKVLEWDEPGEWPESHPRVTRIRAAIVREADNEEEAYEKAIPIAMIDDWLSSVDAPGRELGGHRRVVIRLYTWLLDHEAGIAHSPDWIKYGDDMSCKAAAAEALRMAHDYAQALAKGVASREMKMTMIEIAIWTAVEEKDYA